MSRSARSVSALLVVIALSLLMFGQSANDRDLQKQSEAAELREKGALAIVEQALSNAKNLKLPQNRITVETESLQLFWSRDRSRANGLLNQIVGEFARASSERTETPDSANRLIALRQQRQQFVQFLGVVEPETALRFLAVTRPYVGVEPPEQEEAEERQIQLNLAGQQAARDPRLALDMAEKKLEESDDIPFELLNVLNVLANKDKVAETRLLQEIVSRLEHGDLTSHPQNLNFAVNLLNSRAANPGDRNESQRVQESGGEAEALRSLAESLAAATLSPEFPNDQMANVEACLPALASFAPGQAQSLRQKVAEHRQTMSPDQRSWEEFNQAQGGSAEQLLAVAKRAPSEIRDSMYQQIASNFASAGDFARSRQVAEEDISDPGTRSQILQQGLQQAASAALQKGSLDLARQLIEQVTPAQARAAASIQLALEAANGRKNESFALELLTEADSLLGGRPQNAEEFGGQMQLVQAFARWKPAHAVQLLDRSAKQVNQVLAAAAQVDGFAPIQLSFEQGELVLGDSYLMNSLIAQYAQAAASLADHDLETARSMADRIARPEARLMAEITVARSVLNKHPDRAGYFRHGGAVIFMRYR
jgi:hypothetical protein